jgi:hypothetical protein
MPQGGSGIDQSQRVDIYGRTMGMAGRYRKWIMAAAI